MGVYESLRLHISDDRFVIEPTGGVGLDAHERQLLEIDRLEGTIAVRPFAASRIPGNAIIHDIYGIMGVIELLSGPYLIVITEAHVTGRIFHSNILRVTHCESFRFSPSLRQLSDRQMADEATYLSMLESMLNSGGFHFSHTYDVTHTMQRLSDTDPSFFTQPLHVRADRRFYWNEYLHSQLVNVPDIRDFMLPVTHGFFEITSTSVNGHSLAFILITRRSCRRTGTRFNVRGIDSDGGVANFAETEQIVYYNDQYASFVQVRGSIPVYWSQLPNIKYKPTPQVAPLANHTASARIHFDQLHRLYGRVVAVDLIDQKGPELALGEQFQAVVNQLSDPQLRYIRFDFHKECSKMRWHRLSLLMDQIDADIEQHGYFLLDKSKSVKKKQTGSVRTNCVDCLDRTNVLQSLVARQVVQTQLRVLGLLTPDQRVEDQTVFEYNFKNIWADNADFVSTHYSGTGALKTDFTRTGKRTKQGLLQDGYNSAVRYYKNNFHDGLRQDSIDLFLGIHRVDSAEGLSVESPLHKKPSRAYVLPLVFGLAMSMLMMSVFVPISDQQRLWYIGFWGVGLILSQRVVLFFGPDIVDMPRLTPKGMAACRVQK